MKMCPKCNSSLRWYLKYINGIARPNWHCDNCGYDTVNLKLLLSDKLDMFDFASERRKTDV